MLGSRYGISQNDFVFFSDQVKLGEDDFPMNQVAGLLFLQQNNRCVRTEKRCGFYVD